MAVGIFLLFLGSTTLTESFQDRLRLKESLLVGFFLAGLVVLGSLQNWWLKPILESLSAAPLFLGATLLTATKEVIEAAPAFVRDHAKKSLFERAVEKTQEIRDKTGTSAKDVYEDVKEKAAPAVEKAKEKAKEALDNAGPAVQKAKESVKEAIESAKEKAKDVVDRAKDAAKPEAGASRAAA